MAHTHAMACSTGVKHGTCPASRASKPCPKDLVQLAPFPASAPTCAHFSSRSLKRIIHQIVLWKIVPIDGAASASMLSASSCPSPGNIVHLGFRPSVSEQGTQGCAKHSSIDSLCETSCAPSLSLGSLEIAAVEVSFLSIFSSKSFASSEQ